MTCHEPRPPQPEFSVLLRLPVVVTGDWEQTTGKWRGVARASESLVSVVLLTARGETDWSKSERGKGPELDLTLALFPFEDPVIVQVNVTAGGSGRRVATRLSSVGYRPTIPPELLVRTGDIFQLTAVDGDPLVDVSVLVLAARDVVVGRKGLWHLRDPQAGEVGELLRTILNGGRTGQFRAA